jgi:PAS domain S-box-containing protein
VDEELEVIEVRGRATPYLSLPTGPLTFNLLKLIPDTGFYLEVEKLVREVQASGEAGRRECIPYERDGGIEEVDVEAVPLYGERHRAYLVLFEPRPSAAQPPERATPADNRDRLIAKLKREVADLRQRLLSIAEEHRTTSEENQNAAEEALSSNEELQSLNEELESAKEELQSTNEELITLNQELQSKNTALSQARDFALSIVETVREPLLVLDTELRIKTANQAFYSVFGTSRQETEGRALCSVCGGCWDIPGLRDVLSRVLPDGNPFRDFEIEREFPRVGHKVLVLSGSRLDDLNMILLAIEDITVRREAEKALVKREEHLRQAQKMEAIGRLAGGIAHDFNNLLTAVLGYSDLLLDDLTGGDAPIEHVNEIKRAAEKAASLTDQLLAFSRRKILQPKILDLAAIVADFQKMLRRLLDERIKVVVGSTPDLWRVRVDPGEITRVLMNLCLNARDAMPDGGTLSVQTTNVTLEASDSHAPDLGAGQYVMLAVRDIGIGMDPEMQGHVFEPFFTTKETGKGTGLGLPTVLGIVEQSGGAIWCNSEPGQGTTFKVLLPAVVEAPDRAEPPTRGLVKAPKGSAEVVLLVEDEDMVRRLARSVLEKSGYVVLESSNGLEGVKLCEAHPGPIHLLLSDVVMPELGGRELAERAAMMRPDMKVIFMSGHTQDVLVREGIKRGTPYLQKPFTTTKLARKVRGVLDSQADSPTAGEA